MPEAPKPQEMVTPYRPAVPLTVPGAAWSDAAPLVPGVAATPLPSALLPGASLPGASLPGASLSGSSSASGVTANPAPPVQDPLADIKAMAAAVPDEEDDEDGPYPIWLLDLMDDAPYWMGSMVVHLVVFVLLSILFGSAADDLPPDALAAVAEAGDDLDWVDTDTSPDFEAIGPIEMSYRPVPPDEQTDEPQEPLPSKKPPPETAKDESPPKGLPNVEMVEPLTLADAPLLPRGALLPAAPDLGGGMKLGMNGAGLAYSPNADVMASVTSPALSGALGEGILSGRGEGARSDLVVAAGGSPGSERAVGAALTWLADHQLPDGGWSFNHTQAPTCKGQCRNAGGMAEARNAATAMALLPFLGAGQTHKSGKYKPTVERGLEFLLEHMKDGPEGVPRAWSNRRRGEKLKQAARGSTFFEQGGRMYSHGLASIALCEAYAMTHDKDLREPAQEALDFICFAQDPQGGGWRYRPQERGDTSMVGWQLMALKSGHMAYLKIPEDATAKAMKYLDSVQTNDGANYGYQGPEVRDATTAIGLLSRMYLGWKKDNAGLVKGVDWLSQRGPSRENMYYNYYATQVLRHWEGEKWRRWNLAMREQLVDAQAKEGHEAGSWFLPGNDHGAGPGGRLYFTALAAMTLEVYYRFLPLYRTQSVEERMQGKEE